MAGEPPDPFVSASRHRRELPEGVAVALMLVVVFLVTVVWIGVLVVLGDRLVSTIF